MVIEVSELRVKGACTPLNVTAITSEKPVPEILTRSPGRPLTGENELMTGSGVVTTVKLLALVTVPAGESSRNGPLVAPSGTETLR